MIKKCQGCGAVLQDKDSESLGYVPNLSKNICLRCFKMQNYGYKTLTNLNFTNENIITKINKTANLVFFLVDFLSISNETLTYFKSIKNPKILVMNKIDLLPKSFKFPKIKEFIKNYYDIVDDIIFISAKNKQSTRRILKIMSEYQTKKALLVGYTNSGKSTLINALTNKKLTTSYLPNTTLDFITIHIDSEHTLLDTPGLMPNTSLLDLNEYSLLAGKNIKALTYQMKEDTIINILDKISMQTQNKNSVTVYLSDKINPTKVFKDTLNLPKTPMKINTNSDIIILGVCLINIKEPCDLILGIKDKDLIEIRPSIFS